jgi:hypothetical protein
VGNQDTVDDATLINYLMGALSADDAERIEEISVTDEAIAWRLTSAENDLLDGYARGELAGSAREQFERAYLASPARRQRIAFAKALASRAERDISFAGAGVPAETLRQSQAASRRERKLAWWQAPRFVLQWGFAAAAAVLLILSGYLARENRQIRQEVTNLEASATQKSSPEQSPVTPSQVPANAAALKTVAALLIPATRGIASPPEIRVPEGTDLMVLALRVETKGLEKYSAKLKDGSGHTLWTSGELAASSAGAGNAVSVAIPAELLKAQHYTVELGGARSNGAREFVAGYTFRVIRD